MKIPNYDPYLPESSYEQGHPCIPADVFRMLICWPSNSGKTNVLLHMLYELLAYDKIYISKNLHQSKYQALLRGFDERVNPEVGYKVIEATGDEIIPLEELPVDNQKIVVFDDLVCECNQNIIISYFINGRHRNFYVIYLTQTFYKVPKTYGITAAISAYSGSYLEKIRGLQTKWVFIISCWIAPPVKNSPFSTTINHGRCSRKKFDEDI